MSPKFEVELATIRGLVDSVPAMLAFWDRDQRCVFANRAYESWFGVTPDALIGKTMESLLGPLYALNRPHIEAVLRGEPQRFEREIPGVRGGPPRYSQAEYIPVIVDGEVHGLYVLVTDITARKHAEDALLLMERRLQAAGRLAAVATLAAGIAHEINNPLTSVVTNLEHALAQLGDGASAALVESLREARDGAARVAKIVGNVKQLSRSGGVRREIVDLDQVVRQSLELGANTLRHRARVTCELGDPGAVLADPGQLSQVVLNLLSNAHEALDEQAAERNEIRIRTWRDGAWVTVEVADNGCGIPEAIRERIFEPFFTTGDVGEGMGIGLSIANAVVKELGGRLELDSAVGRGSAFRMVLPAAPAASTAAVADPAPPPAVAPSRRARLLVIDDEALITRSLVRILRSDFEVEVENDSRGAVARLVAGAHDLVLCDLMMPNVTGAEVYRRAIAARPELAQRFVFMTGGAFTDSTRAFLDEVSAPVLGKPFVTQDLRDLLAARLADLPPAAAR